MSLLRKGLAQFRLTPVLKLLALQRVGALKSSPQGGCMQTVAAAPQGYLSLVLTLNVQVLHWSGDEGCLPSRTPTAAAVKGVLFNVSYNKIFLQSPKNSK